MSVKKKLSLPKELYQLETVVGQFMEYWGFKNIHGRIWTHIFLSETPLEVADLMDRLEVSKGLMSLAIRDLLDYEVILADHVGRHGSTFYRANPNVLDVISNILKTRENEMLKKASSASQALSKMSSEKLKKAELSEERIQNVLQLTSSAQFILQAFLQRNEQENYSFLFDTNG